MKEVYLLSLLLAPYYWVQSNVASVEQDFTSYGCVCKDYNCGCCAHLEVPRVGLNDTGCVNLTYLPKEYGISFTMTIDNLVIYNETISARNPPPICFGAPMLKEYAELCVHFYDLSVSTTKAHGCVQVEARLHKVVVATYKIGCFDIGNIDRWKKYHKKLIEKILRKESNITLKLA
ncbi:uncharacterized protein LOC129229805 [Uloborus diversus]|uniref:uncharacterized protein LOC129229805 n=1 Tax=Uloborus diversus TaxID=327109 RepID=UPI00240A3372|nr:uncharacterized protein LOC129229805 [Uloborus diversus]